MRHALRTFAATAVAVWAMSGTAISANDAGFVTYTVKSRDTLYDIAQDYLDGPAAASRLAKLNNVRNPRRLQVDRQLRIPRDMLRYEAVALEVASFSGPVRIGGSAPVRGAALREGQVIETGRGGFITFTSAFGGRVSLPSNTAARLVRARRYVLGNTLDVDFRVDRGRATATSPSLQGQDELRMRTPLAVTAVRGTEFRVAYDPDSGEFSLTEVTEGEVNVAAGEEESIAPAGFGISSSADGVGEPEQLLPVPAYQGFESIQTGELVEFAIDPVAGAKGYRIQIGTDADLIDMIAEQVVDQPQASFGDFSNGRYFIRTRAIAASGLEGLSESMSFRRKRLGVEATAGPSDDYDGYKFAWRPETSGDGEEATTYAFQIWAEGNRDALLVDEVGLTITELLLTDLAEGRYNWRVAVSQPDEEVGLLKVWGPEKLLVVTE